MSSDEGPCHSCRFFFPQREYYAKMINKENAAFTMLNPNPETIGVLTDTEVLLVDVVQRKRVLRSILLPPDMSELSGLLEYLWQFGLTSVWVMPATTLSRTATCVWFEH